MADQKISELTLVESCTTEDYFPLVDYSAGPATRRIKPKAFMMSGVTTLKFATSGVSRDVIPMIDVSGGTISKITMKNFLLGSLFRSGATRWGNGKTGATVTFSSAFPDINYTPLVGVDEGVGGVINVKRYVGSRNLNADQMWIGGTPTVIAARTTLTYFCIYNG